MMIKTTTACGPYDIASIVSVQDILGDADRVIAIHITSGENPIETSRAGTLG
jgi:hypothetical protein